MPSIRTFDPPPPPGGQRKLNGHVNGFASGSRQLSQHDLDAFEQMEEEPSSWTRAMADEEDTRGESSDMDVEHRTDNGLYGDRYVEEESEQEDEGLVDEGAESDEEEGMRAGKVHVHVEVRLKRETVFRLDMLVLSYIHQTYSTLKEGQKVRGWSKTDSLRRHVERIVVAEISGDNDTANVEDCELHIHMWMPSGSSVLEEFAADSDDDDSDETKVPAASVRELPSMELDGQWENLVYDNDIKSRLLDYIHSTVAFSDAEIDFNVVTWNRMVLLHGPPGTGKTSLCRGLAQKLSIRLSHRYKTGKIVEINSHSLFSKWFSESGKLVQKLFSAVHRMVDDEDCFVVVMIDEVESLTTARSSALTGNEPGDAVRVVNALLTQLDKLKTRKNVLVMATSNIAGAIDPAFVDRADIKEHVGYPPAQAVYWILTSCLNQLMDGGMVKKTPIANWSSAQHSDGASTGAQLVRLARRCHECNLAGRFLRRLPVLAHARYIAPKLLASPTTLKKSLRTWLNAMEALVEDEWRSREQIKEADGHREKQDNGDLSVVKQE